jgi:CHAT domain-containing protein/Flp pilus assembly protein TadD
MSQWIYSIVITMLLAGCAVQHETINLPEKNEQVVVQDKKETKNVDSEKNISPERQHWNEIMQQVVKAYQSRHYSQGIAFAEKAYQYALNNFGETDQETLTSINNLGFLYQSQGRYGKAEPLYKRCLQHRDEVLGPKHPSTLTSINNLAGLYDSQGKYGEAEPLYKRCLQLREEVLGPKHPDTLTSINNLAESYRSQGRYGEAEPLFKRCLQLSEEVLGPKHPNTLSSINNLAGLYDSQGRHGEAEPLYKRCLQLREEVLGPKHPSTLGSINNLAESYRSQGRYGEAEPLYKRCLQLIEEVLGPKHPNTLSSINNLALLYNSQGRYGEAEPLHKRCLQLREEVLGPKHPSTLDSINNLAALYQFQGRYGEAEPIYKRCLQLCEEILGPKHPNTLTISLNYFACLVMLKQDNQALLHLKKMELSLRHYAGDMLKTTQQLRVRRKFMMSKSNFQGALFTLAFQSKSPAIQAFAGDVILRWKCIQEEAETIMNRLIHSSQDPRIIQLGQNINSLRRQMSIFNPKVDMNALIQELEQQEVKLAQLSDAYQHYLNKSNVRMDDLKLMLPPKTAVIELKQYQHVNFKTGEWEDMRLAAALILPNAERIILEDLGARKDVVAIFDKIRTAKNQQEKTPALKQLYSKLFGVFDPHIAQAETIYISPDGLTHQIAFSRLILPDGQFWVQRQTLCRIQTSRDLLDPAKQNNKGTLVAMGGIDYNQFPGIAEKATPHRFGKHDLERSIKRTAEKIESFDSLPSSKIEIEYIKVPYLLSQQKTPLIFRDASASENQLKHLKSPPHVLHLATHGFYLEKSESVTERPMLLSGLALAGCNLGLKGKKGPENEDGLLYAIEVAGLDLSGTELVVLSACDTGKGTIDYSEGVYGLLRAFRLAGAQNIVMTLWPLKDQSAKDFFTSFYKTWLSKSNMTPLKALRQTQLSFIQQNKDSTLWAPYVMVGGKIQ